MESGLVNPLHLRELNSLFVTHPVQITSNNFVLKLNVNDKYVAGSTAMKVINSSL